MDRGPPIVDFLDQTRSSGVEKTGPIETDNLLKEMEKITHIPSYAL